MFGIECFNGLLGRAVIGTVVPIGSGESRLIRFDESWVKMTFSIRMGFRQVLRDKEASRLAVDQVHVRELVQLYDGWRFRLAREGFC